MGCFNAACSISHLDIKVGDKCYFLILKPNQFRETECSVLCYPDDRYKLLCFPIVGEYDDYGKIEEIERNEHIEYLESYFGISIESLIEIACEGRDVYDSYSEKYNQFIDNKEIMEYDSSILDLMKALFKEEICGNSYSYQHKNDIYLFQIQEKKYTILKNGMIFDMSNIIDTPDFLRNFYNLTGIYLNIKNKEIFEMLNDISGCFVLKDIADSLMSNKDFWKNDFSDIEYWNFTPSIAYHLGFKEVSFNNYLAIKKGKEYHAEFKDCKAIINGIDIRDIKDLQKITNIFDKDIHKLEEKFNHIDLCSYDFKIGIMAKYGLIDKDNFWEYNLDLGYLYDNSYSFRLNIPMKSVYRKKASNWNFDTEYLISEKLYQIFYVTNNMMSPTCNASQTDKRNCLLMLYNVAKEWTDKKIKEDEEWN